MIGSHPGQSCRDALAFADADGGYDCLTRSDKLSLKRVGALLDWDRVDLCELGPLGWEVDLKGCVYTLARILSSAEENAPVDLPTLSEARRFLGMRLAQEKKERNCSCPSVSLQVGCESSPPGHECDLEKDFRLQVRFLKSGGNCVRAHPGLNPTIDSRSAVGMMCHDGFYVSRRPDVPTLQDAARDAVNRLVATLLQAVSQSAHTLVDLEAWVEVRSLQFKYEASFRELTQYVSHPPREQDSTCLGLRRTVIGPARVRTPLRISAESVRKPGRRRRPPSRRQGLSAMLVIGLRCSEHSSAKYSELLRGGARPRPMRWAAPVLP